MKNEKINAEINRQNFLGKTDQDLKDLYIERNAFDVPINSEVYRIFQAPFLLDDIASSKITLLNIRSSVFNDPLENPLFGLEFSTEEGDSLFLDPLVENYFGQSWTEESLDEYWRWEAFSHGTNFGVRVKASLRNVMHRLVQTQNKYFMLRYFVGKVTYHDPSYLADLTKSHTYNEFLDSLGHGITRSLTAIRKEFSDEKEIRILYDYEKEDDYAKSNVTVNKGLFCKHPFDWSGVIEEVLLDPRMPDSDASAYCQELRNKGIMCSISRSRARP
ncbi:hypothetical protein PPMP20_09060 [Paraburkholderia phymatum]|uniref:Uncharacterized protein n=1 Tax=Paraburkholderia phymatum (strain DSM 17167 / CIP 108236 / LMG 21445 / STM815) TaxID=391038 RepID=B2JC76_PARP8|nr:hypothetical protein [Paraburkholderia phymatum]ACC69440.1 hypothetical protein Bphy_0247 [Paraburkholderia phymatum STM815]